MRHACIVAALVGAVLSFSGCDREPTPPPVSDGEVRVIATIPPTVASVVDRARVITVVPERLSGVVGEPIRLWVSVRDRAGAPLVGERVALESSVESDELTPAAGATDWRGILEAKLEGEVAGVRTVVARAGDAAARTSLDLSPAHCGGGVLVGGFGPVEQVLPSGRYDRLRTGSFGQGTCELAMLRVGSAGGAELIVRSAPGDAWRRIDLPGGSASEFATGDFDGDGLDDMAVAAFDEKGSRIDWLVSKGDGAWEPAATLELPERIIHSISAGDFDGDGRIDLLVEHSALTDGTDRILQVAFSAGGAVRLGETRVSIEPRIRFVAGDLDGDGRADLAIHDPRAREVSVMRGAGDGAFAESSRYAANAAPVQALDLDGDGLADVVGFSHPLEGFFVEVARGRGDLRLETTTFASPTVPDAVAAGDFDGDGRPDLFLVSSGPGEAWLRVALGREDGSFHSAATASSLPVVDVDGFAVCHHAGRDRPEVVVLANGSLLVVPVDALGCDRSITVWPPHLGGIDASAIADLDGDGVPEVAWLHSDGVLELLQFESDGVRTMAEAEVGWFRRTEPIALMRLGSDPIGGLVWVQSNDAGGEELWLHPLSGGRRSRLAEAERIFGIATGDLDGDGTNDLAFCTTDAVAVLLADHRGSFRLDQAAPVGCRAIAAGDFDGDGGADLAVLGEEGLSVLVGDPGIGYRIERLNDVDGSSVAFADLDGDGRNEILVGGPGELIVIGGGAAGGLPDVVRLSTSGGPVRNVAAGDFDRDGLVDVAAIEEGPAIALLFQDGAGGFLPAQRFSLGIDPHRSAVGFLPGGSRLGLTAVNGLGFAHVIPIDGAPVPTKR